jgi:RimJ/RimL family protein N-acetyltransferase
VKPVIRFRAAEDHDARWFCATLNLIPTTEFGGIVAYNDQFAMGMVGFDNWTPNSVMMHFHIRQPRCLIPLWNEALGYLSSYGRRIIIGSTASDNIRALRVIKKLGWVEKTRIIDGWSDGVDLIISEYRIHEPKRSLSS